MVNTRRFTGLLILLVIFIVIIFTIELNIVKNLSQNIINQRCQKQTLSRTTARGVKTFYTTIPFLNSQESKRLVHDVDCQQIIEGNKSQISFASELLKHMNYSFLTDDNIRELAQNCEIFLRNFDYNRFMLSQEEINFPIAFSLLAHKDAVQVEMLLRAIFRPHNVYCIHIDRKSNTLLDAMRAVTKCLPNVFIASRLEDVIYQGFSRLQADINFMTDLLHYTKVKWKYLINLPAQEYPLKTNAEIVKILNMFNGTNSIESVYSKETHYRVKETYRVNPKTLKLEGTGHQKDPPPHNITVGKGSAYGAFSRSFVNFSLNDIKAQELLNWTRDTFSPDETFWATLAINKHIGVPGIIYTASGVPDRKLWITTSTTWKSPGAECHGRFVRDICVFGLGDLQKLVSEKELFANKFYHDNQPYALKCLEEWIFNKTFSSLPVDLYYYRRLLKSAFL